VAFSSLSKKFIRRGREILKSSESIKNNNNFREVYHNGKSYANKYLVMYILNNNSEMNRIGISVSKKVGNSVVRHRLTRLIRESYRLNEEMFNSGLDIVVVARAGARGRDYSEINSAFMHLAKMHKILKEMIKS
jgi:ribonuclease P protein component